MCSVFSGGPVPWLMRSDHETGLSPLSGADVKRVFSCTSSSIYSLMTPDSLKRRDIPCLRMQVLLASTHILTPFRVSKRRASA
jgi:hypothetical protein